MNAARLDWKSLEPLIGSGTADRRRRVVRPVDVLGLTRLLEYAQNQRIRLSLGSAPGPGRALAVDLGAMDRIGEVDPLSRTVHVQAGIRVVDLCNELDRRGYRPVFFFSGPRDWTLGHALSDPRHLDWGPRLGPPANAMLALEAVLPGGRVVQTRPAPRRATGPDLAPLILTHTPTMAVFTGATLALDPKPLAARTLSWRGGSVADGLAGLRRLFDRGGEPTRIVATVQGRKPRLEVEIRMRFDGSEPSVQRFWDRADGVRPHGFDAREIDDETWPRPVDGFLLAEAVDGPTTRELATAIADAGFQAILGRFDGHLVGVATADPPDDELKSRLRSIRSPLGRVEPSGLLRQLQKTLDPHGILGDETRVGKA